MKTDIDIIKPILAGLQVTVMLGSSACNLHRDERYVSALAGLNIRTAPSAQARIVGLLPFAMKTRVLEEQKNYENISGARGRWTRIECTEAPQCWVFGAYLELDPPRLFYRVEVTAGLNLRAEPSVNGRVITGLPYRAIGSVDAISPRIERIEDRNGFWFRTTFKGQEGWIFSGFTTTSRNESELSEDWVYDPEIKDVPELKDPAWKEGRIRKVVDAGGFWIHEIEYPAVHDALMIAKRNNYVGGSIDYCAGPESRVVFVHKQSGRAFSVQGYAEWIERVDHPMIGIVRTSGHGCWCCCPHPLARQYLLEQDRVTTVDLLLGQNEIASCEFSAGLFGTSIRSAIDARLKGHAILINWKKPECSLSEEQKLQVAQGQKITFENVQKFSHRTFIRLEKKGDGYRLTKRFETDIPEEYSQEWASAATLEWIPRTELIQEVSPHH